MAWQDEMVAMLRVMVGDVADTPRYTDERLEGALAVSAKLVLGELAFSQDFVGSASDISITPDPTATASRDDAFVNLVCARTACILDQGGAASAAGQSILVKDGASLVDLRGRFDAMKSLLEKGWCAVYAEMKDAYLVGNSGSASNGVLIMGAVRVYAWGDGGPAGLVWRR